MKWKVIKQIDTGSKSIPKGSVLTQVKDLDIELSVNRTMQALNRMHPYKRMVVCNFNYGQHIFEVGRDVIPFGRGVK